MDKWVVSQVLAFWIECDIVHLISKVCRIADAMLVKTCLPNFAPKLISDCMGKAALDALNTALNDLAYMRG